MLWASLSPVTSVFPHRSSPFLMLLVHIHAAANLGAPAGIHSGRSRPAGRYVQNFLAEEEGLDLLLNAKERVRSQGEVG